MKVNQKSPPRQFQVKDVTLSHQADIQLDADELVTFKTDSGKEMDVTAKDWGYYLGGSTNNRNIGFGYITVIARNPDGQIYILAYEKEKEAAFMAYLKEQSMEIIQRLDQDVTTKT